MAARYGSLPFEEQILFFRRKLQLPTRAWTDIYAAEHEVAFMVAGATKADLVSDFYNAIDKAISEGTTLEQFRKSFDTIVEEHGWSYKGGRNWRSRVIYDTNLRTSYAAGRYAQMQEVAESRPYWRYRHSDAVEHPRPEHEDWDGTVLRHDDPWWHTHFPPNGWGCQCYVETLAERDLARLKKDGPDEAPLIVYEPRTVGATGPNPRTVLVPQGIDPGFEYQPGSVDRSAQLRDELARKSEQMPAGIREAFLAEIERRGEA